MYTLQELAQELFNDPSVDEALIDGHLGLSILRGDRREARKPIFQDAETWLSFLQEFAFSQGVQLDPMHPAAGGALSLMQGNVHIRWHSLLPPLARDGALLSLRRHRLERLVAEDFMEISLWRQLIETLAPELPLFIFGPTGAGKTSFLFLLLRTFARQERVAILEQIPELPRLEDLWLRFAARPPDLAGRGGFALEFIVDELLRLRPDRIVIGELRREEGKAWLKALSTGHMGTWVTLHASTVDDLVPRLSEMAQILPLNLEQRLNQLRPYAIAVQRKKPRFAGLWQFREGKWTELISSDGIELQKFS